MEIGSIGKSIVGNKVKKSIESGKVSLNNILDMGKNISEMTKGTREENKKNFNTILQEKQTRNTDEGR